MPAAPSATSTLVQIPPAGGQPSPEGQAMPAQPGELDSWTTRIFFGVQIVLAAVLISREAPLLRSDDFLILSVLIALNVVTHFQPIRLYGDSTITLSSVPMLAIIILIGAPGVVVAAPIAAFTGRWRNGTMDYKAITNAARFVVVYCAAAFAYSLFGTTDPSAPDAGFALGGIAAIAVDVLLSPSLVMISARLRTGQAWDDIWAKTVWAVPHYAAVGVLGLAFTAAYIALGIPGILAFVAPAVMMRLSMKQYVDKTAENVQKLQEQNTALTAANIQIVRVSEELAQSYDGTLEALVNALDARDQETKAHSLRVSRYMMDIARELGIKEGTQQWVDMQRGSLLHDVGKIGITDAILLKPGKLTDEEWVTMRKHPEIGYNMLRQVRFLEGAAEIILGHHERWDGKGYPRGLREQEIPLGARIFPVVDTFDSMTSDRPYRKALSPVDAMNEILKYGGSQFDPLVVEAFLDIYDTWVKQWGILHAETDIVVIKAA